MNVQVLYSINSALTHLQTVIDAQVRPTGDPGLVQELSEVRDILSEAAAHLESDQAQGVHS